MLLLYLRKLKCGSLNQQHRGRRRLTVGETLRTSHREWFYVDVKNVRKTRFQSAGVSPRQGSRVKDSRFAGDPSFNAISYNNL